MKCNASRPFLKADESERVKELSYIVQDMKEERQHSLTHIAGLFVFEG